MITRANGAEREMRSFALTDMVRWGYKGLRSISSAVDPQSVAGVPAIARGVRIRAEALASLELCVWRGAKPYAEPVSTVWQAKLVGGRPNPFQTRFTFWETVGESLGYRNNAYIWMNSDPPPNGSGRVLEWYALHPDQVLPVGVDEFRVKVRPGFIDPVGKGPGEYRVDSSIVLHIRGYGAGGQRVAPSAIQVFADAMGIPISRQKHEQAMWQNGTNVRSMVTIPGMSTPEQMQAARDQWRDIYSGTDGETTAFLPTGSDVKPIGMTMDEAEFATSADLTVHDAARITGVPTKLLAPPTATKPELMEDVLREWYLFGLGPDCSRIEDALKACEVLFGTATSYPMFKTADVVRGDLTTEANIEHQQIQDGTLLPDEARAARGRPPLPGTVTLQDGTVVPTGMAPIITPAGAAPAPIPQPVPAADPAET